MALRGKERRRGKKRKESVRIGSWLCIHIPVPLSSRFSELVLRGLHQGSHRSSHFSETEKRAGSGVAGTDTERRQAAGTGERNTAQENKQGAKKKKDKNTQNGGEHSPQSHSGVTQGDVTLRMRRARQNFGCRSETETERRDRREDTHETGKE